MYPKEYRHLEVRFIVNVVTLIQHKMAEKRALRSIFDNSVISERIVALKRSKAEHLSEITKIYRRLTEYCRD